MSKDLRMKHGSLGWGELMTTDPEAAKAFYSELFGWKMQDMPNPNNPEETYTTASVGDLPMMGIMKRPAECENIPPCWGMYITVDDIEETASKAEANGGKICYPITEIKGIGKFCCISDPQGAVISAMQYSGQCCKEEDCCCDGECKDEEDCCCDGECKDEEDCKCKE